MIKRNILVEYVNDLSFPEKSQPFTVMFACSVCVSFHLIWATKPIYSKACSCFGSTQSHLGNFKEKKSKGKETDTIDSKSRDC